MMRYTRTIEIKNGYPLMNLCKQIMSRKITNPIYNFKIIELIIDMIVNSTVKNKQLKTLSRVLCMKMKTQFFNH